MVDKEPKTKNDRTWCFWEKEDGFFESIVYKKWDTISFLSDEFSSSMNISPYQYKMIRGIDFYNFCFDEIKNHKNIEVVFGEVKDAGNHKEGAFIILNNKPYNLDNTIFFSSILQKEEQQKGYNKLLQHFKGWLIETDNNYFNPAEAIMMDFRVSQNQGTTFAYVLPFNGKTALVEYTLFTKELLAPEQYNAELRNYIKSFLKIEKYTIREEEFGVIPMTNEKFSFYKDGVFHIGTVGGQTKASSGYTFQFIQKQSQMIADCLSSGDSLLSIPDSPKRFRFYDNTLLHILYHNKLPGKEIFTRLFRKNKPQQVLRFMDNESSLGDELKIISSLPTWPFLKAALRQL